MSTYAQIVSGNTSQPKVVSDESDYDTVSPKKDKESIIHLHHKIQMAKRRISRIQQEIANLYTHRRNSDCTVRESVEDSITWCYSFAAAKEKLAWAESSLRDYENKLRAKRNYSWNEYYSSELE